jgi:hypothetical protein
MDVDPILRNLPAALACLMVAILFLQSGLDKALDWSGNREFLKSHFSKTFLSPLVPVMMVKITILELATGLLGAAAIIYFLATGSTRLMFWTGTLGSLTVVGLFFGQRVAKDYPGAAVLVPYFLLMLALVYLTNPYTRA